MIHFIFIFLLSFSSLLFAQSNLVITKPGTSFTDFTVDMYEDSSASLSFEEVKHKKFVAASNRISEGYSKSYFWFKFKIKNATDSKLEYFIHLTENFLHEVDCYIVSESGEFLKYKDGVGNFSDNTLNKLKKPTFQINLNSKDSKTVYIRIYSLYPNFTAINIFNEKSLNEYKLKFEKVYYLFFGAIIALLLYNLALSLFTAIPSYLYYVLYGASFVTWELLLMGFVPFNTFDSTSTFYLSGSSIALTIVFVILFGRAILDTKILLPNIDKTLKYATYISIVLTFSFIFFMQESLILINILTTFLLPFLFYVGFKSYAAGNKTAIFYIIAQSFFLFTSILFSLMSFGYLEYNLLTRHSLTIGYFIEMILFSLALSYRIRVLKNEKIKVITDATIKLEQEVKLRTKELKHLNRNLEDRVKEEVEKNRLQYQQMFNQSRLAQMGEMISMIAHQWRQPLGAISATSVNLQMKLELQEFDSTKQESINKWNEYLYGKLENINDYVQNLTTTIDDFRNFYKPNKKSVSIQLDEVVTKALKIINTSLINSDIEIVQEYNSNQKIELYDSELIHVILNILKNSQDNFKEQKSKNPKITITTKKNSLSICDNGGGIAEDIMDEIFDPYFSTKSEKNGTGLGLYMSKIIVEEHHNGKLIVENKDGGVCFNIELSKIKQ